MPPQPKQKTKAVELPPEDNYEFVPVGEHERVLSIFISGRFTPKDPIPLGTILREGEGGGPLSEAEAQHNNNPTTNSNTNAAGGDASKRATPSPTGPSTNGKRSGTPGKKDVAAEAPAVNARCSNLAKGTYTNFTFSPCLNRPFFSLFVPGLDVVGGGQPQEESVEAPQGLAGPAGNSAASRQSAGREASPKASKEQSIALSAAQTQARPGDECLLRIIPRGDQVNTDGTFKIEMYRKKLRIDETVVDTMLAQKFRFQVHTVPDIEVMTAKYSAMAAVATTVELNSTITPSKRGVAGKAGSIASGAGGNANNTKNNKHAKVSVDPVEHSQDPLTVGWMDCNTLLTRAFDLSNVFQNANVDRIELVQPSDALATLYASTAAVTSVKTSEKEPTDGAGEEDVTPQGFKDIPVDIHTLATRAQLTKSHARRTVLYSQQLPGFDGLTLSIVCTEPLLSKANLQRYMPMIIDIQQALNIPPLGKQSLDLRHTMVPREDEVNFAPTQHKATATSCCAYDAEGQAKLGGPRFAPVRVTVNGIRTYENPLSTASQKHARDITFNERFVVFLYKYSNLELYEHFFFRGMDLCLHDRDLMVVDLVKEVSPSYRPPSAFGIASIPLRGAISGELMFTISAQVIPRKDAGSGDSTNATYPADYLSNATTIKAKVQLLARLPKARYVTPPYLITPFPKEGLFSNRFFLTRAVFVLPYKGLNAQQLLQGLMGNLIRFAKVSEMAGRVFELPPPEKPAPRIMTPPEDDPNLKKSAQAAKAKAAGAKGSKKGAVEEEVPTKEDELQSFEETLRPVAEEATFVVPEGVSGFEVIDGDQRIICIEGYGHMLYSTMEVVTDILGPQADEDPRIRILFNTDLAFPQRWYHTWPSLIKPMPHLFNSYDADSGRTHSASSANNNNSPQPPSTRLGEGDQSPRAKGEGGGRKGGASKPPKLTAAQKQAASDAAAAEEQRLAKEKELVAMAEAEAARRAALKGDRDELDSGGVGGRIRRIRLSRSIDELVGQQRNFMRRFLSSETLACISKLNHLRSTKSLVNAVDHDFFPTAEELIALERVQGGTLEVFDICGSDTYYTFDKGMVDAAVTEAGRVLAMDMERRSVKREIPVTQLLSQGLTMAHAGRMLTFIGTPAHPSQLGKLPKLVPEYFPRHQNRNYMMIDGAKSSTGGPLFMLCCYPGVPPKQLLKYSCNAQVIGALERADAVEQVPILFVLHHETVAKNGSDDRNPAYEEHLRREKRRADPREFKRIVAQRKAHYLATHSSASAGRLGDSDEEDAEGFADPPPYVPDDSQTREGLLDGLLVRNDYVTLNRNVEQTLKNWGKNIPETPRREREEQAHNNALYQQMYDAQTQRLAAIDAKVASTVQRANHSKAFVSGNAKTIEEARVDYKFIAVRDTLSGSDPYIPPLTTTRSIGGKANALNPQPMSFSGGRTVVEETNLDDLLPPALKTRLQTAQKALTKAEESEAEAERIRREKEEWQSRLVVDSPHFSVNTRRPREKPMSSIDQYQSILHDPPMKSTIKKNYAPPPPPSIRTAERIIPNQRVEPYESKHPERRTFYVGKGGEPSTFLKDFPMVSDEERQKASVLYGAAPEN